MSKVYAFLLNLPNKNHRKTKIFKKMAEFIYQEPFPIEADTTEYRLLTKDYVKVVEYDGRQILKVVFCCCCHFQIKEALDLDSSN